MEKTLVGSGIVMALLCTLSVPLYASDMDEKDSHALQNISTLKGISESVENGSIKVDEDEISESQMAGLAKVKIDGAINIAQKTVDGKVIQVKLDDEEGFLIWDVEVLRPSNGIVDLKIDAGNGALLAVEQGESNRWWKFWD